MYDDQDERESPILVRFRVLCNKRLEPCQVRKEAALRGSAWVPQITRDLAISGMCRPEEPINWPFRQVVHELSGTGP